MKEKLVTPGEHGSVKSADLRLSLQIASHMATP